MKEFLKAILKASGVYHPLQRFYRQTLSAAKYKKIRKEFEKHRGTGFYCNVCGASYKIFVPDYPASQNSKALEKNNVIAGYGKNIYCPDCMSTARERLVIAMLGKMNIHGKKFLHLSPEENVFRYISGKGEIITADLEPGFYKSIDSSIMQTDVTNLSFANHSFDIVIGNHIMEHIPDDLKAMEEIYRVLKPEGIAILQVPFSTTIPETIEEPSIKNPKMQSELFGQKDHVRIYNLQDYINLLKSVGFSVEYLSYASLSEYYDFAIQPGEGFIQIMKPAAHTLQAFS